MIAVEDEGPGVAASDRERIWRPFARQHHAGEWRQRHWSRSCAKSPAHGGTAHVEQSASGGARFVVTLR